MRKNKRLLIILGVTVFLVALGFLSTTVAADNTTSQQQHFGVLSIVPPLTVIILALLTRQVLLSFFVAVWLGGLFTHGGILLVVSLKL